MIKVKVGRALPYDFLALGFTFLKKNFKGQFLHLSLSNKFA